MPELGDDELAPVVREELKEVPDSADAAIGILGRVEILGLDVDADNPILDLKAEIENRPAARQVNGHKTAARTDGLPVLL